MIEIQLTDAEIGELLDICRTAMLDADLGIQQSHDIDEVSAYREHKNNISKWITRFKKLEEKLKKQPETGERREE